MNRELQWALVIFGSGTLAILFALVMARYVLSRGRGTAQMRQIADEIYEGAVAYLHRQYTTIAILAGITSVLIGALIAWMSSESLGSDRYRLGG